MTRLSALLAALVLVAVLPETAEAANPEGTTVEVAVAGDGYLELNGRRYRGPFSITAQSDGVAVVETITLDHYLEGIREVPFSWHPEALAAQVVAARSYLASTLAGGRTETGARIGYDICATAACQVYAGVDAVLGEDGDRWREAVARTSGQILVHDGAPARAYYSSTTGGRTRNIEDIWPGSPPAPYLVGVPSAGEDSPFVEWSWELPAFLMERLLREAGVAEGRVRTVTTRTTENGEGPWMIDVISDAGTVSLDTWAMRSRINEAARILPALLPARRPDGERFPTTILSPEYSITREIRLRRLGANDHLDPYYLVEGGGWGHLLGMSQYGAQAMARAGSSYQDILAHYYSGLTPVAGDGFLPEQVAVGLVIGAESVSVSTDRVLSVTVDGVPVEVTAPGPWKFRFEEDRLVVVAPVLDRHVPPGLPNQPF